LKKKKEYFSELLLTLLRKDWNI